MPTLSYDLAIVGVANVDRALSGLEKRFVQHNARMARAVGGPNRAIRGANPDADLGRSFQQIARAGMAADRQRYAAQRREEANAQREKLRNIRDLAKADERLQAQRSRALYAATQQQARAAAAAQREFRARVGSITGSFVGKVGGAISGVGRAALAATGLGGGAIIASRLSPAMGLEKAQRALVVTGTPAGQQAPYSYEQIEQIVKNRSIATGQNQEDITAGLREYVSATGDLKGAVEQVTLFGTVATAAEANVRDVSKAAAYLAKAMGISAKEMPQALSTLYFQGKKGAFELKDIAEAVPILGSQAATLGIKGVGGLQTLGGLAQIAQTGTGNPAEAQTALSNLFTQIVAKAAKVQSGAEFGGHRVQVFEHGDPTKPLRDIRLILADIIAASRGNVTQLEGFGEIRGSRALNPLVAAYRGAAEGTHGTEAQKVAAGRKAVLDMIADNADAAGKFSDVQRDAGEVMKSTSVQLEALNTKLTASVQEKLLPAFIRLEPSVEKLLPLFETGIEKLADFIEYFAGNPFKGLGAIVAAKVTADLAGAGIQAAASAGITSLITSIAARFGGAGASGIPGGIPAATSGPLAVAGAALPAATSLLGVGYESYQLAKEVSGGGRKGGGIQGIKDTISTVLNGPTQPLTPEQYDAVYGRGKTTVSVAAQQAPQGSVPDKMNKAADRLIGAAEKLSQAAARSGAPSPVSLNRSNSPSPVKP